MYNPSTHRPACLRRAIAEGQTRAPARSAYLDTRGKTTPASTTWQQKAIPKSHPRIWPIYYVMGSYHLLRRAAPALHETRLRSPTQVCAPLHRTGAAALRQLAPRRGARAVTGARGRARQMPPEQRKLRAAADQALRAAADHRRRGPEGAAGTRRGDGRGGDGHGGGLQERSPGRQPGSRSTRCSGALGFVGCTQGWVTERQGGTPQVHCGGHMRAMEARLAASR